MRVVGEVAADEFFDWLQSAFGTLDGALARAGVEPAGPRATLYGAEIVDDGPEPAEAFIPIEWPIESPVAAPLPSDRAGGVTIGEVPAARVAVLVHAGDYDSIGDTYRTLGAWVARNAEHAGERVREWYVVGPADTDDPGAYRTEIAWPILPS